MPTRAPALLQIEFESFERARTFHLGAVLALTQIQILLLKHHFSQLYLRKIFLPRIRSLQEQI